MEQSTVLAQLKTLLDQGNAEAHTAGHTAGRAFEAERIRQEANRLAAEQDELPPEQRLKSTKAVMDELFRRAATSDTTVPAPAAAQEGFEAVAPAEPAKAATKTKAR